MLSRGCPGAVPGLSRGCPGAVPGLSRGYPGAVLGLSRGCPGAVPEPSRAVPGNSNSKVGWVGRKLAGSAHASKNRILFGDSRMIRRPFRVDRRVRPAFLYPPKKKTKIIKHIYIYIHIHIPTGPNIFLLARPGSRGSGTGPGSGAVPVSQFYKTSNTMQLNLLLQHRYCR